MKIPYKIGFISKKTQTRFFSPFLFCCLPSVGNDTRKKKKRKRKRKRKERKGRRLKRRERKKEKEKEKEKERKRKRKRKRKKDGPERQKTCKKGK